MIPCTKLLPLYSMVYDQQPEKPGGVEEHPGNPPWMVKTKTRPFMCY
jgi:hypothetical protein